MSVPHRNAATRLALVLLLATVSAVAGCSRRAWYEGVRMSGAGECRNLTGTQREECLRDAEMSYEEYTRKRRGE